MASIMQIKGKCADESGIVRPEVNFNNCGAKEDCVAICPYDVFEMRPITKSDKSNLNMKGKIKTFFYNNKSYLKNPELCHACGLCVSACPENAIKLTKMVY